ncbi:MAG TPA: sulfatase-like hydrolase/transferase [Candidatus Gallacutalibacter stercoravium]|nr:sulfatase-like hydrolase/transferase [Candidatus Gallacutalibacter stercoravium]
MKNILFLQCDQLNASVLDVYGGPVHTKHISRLAQQSVVFDAAYCSTPLCTPSRASMITGQYPHNHGIVSNVMRRDYPVLGGPETEQGIENQDETTDKVLWRNGFKTAHYGKWHLSGEELAYYPQRYREHQEYEQEMQPCFAAVAQLPPEQWLDWYGWKLPVEIEPSLRQTVGRYMRAHPQSGSATFNEKTGRLLLPVEDTFDYRVAERCVSFLQQVGDAPFALTCSLNAPHDPNVIPSPYYERVDPAGLCWDEAADCDPYFAQDWSRLLPRETGKDFMREFLRVYYASVLYVDDMLGRVLQALKETGKWENTVIVFASDHGDMAGEHGMFWKSTNAFYDGIARVPLFVKDASLKPGRFAPPVELIDLPPTLLALCGIKAPEGMDGKSLIPYLQGQKDPGGLSALSERLDWNEGHTREKRFYNSYGFMLRNSRYKYCRYRQDESVHEFLYDMEQDPGEQCNLAVGLPKKAADIEALEHMRTLLRNRLLQTGCRFQW